MWHYLGLVGLIALGLALGAVLIVIWALMAFSSRESRREEERLARWPARQEDQQ
jgi:hypothetical protein